MTVRLFQVSNKIRLYIRSLSSLSLIPSLWDYLQCICHLSYLYIGVYLLSPHHRAIWLLVAWGQWLFLPLFVPPEFSIVPDTYYVLNKYFFILLFGPSKHINKYISFFLTCHGYYIWVKTGTAFSLGIHYSLIPALQLTASRHCVGHWKVEGRFFLRVPLSKKWEIIPYAI